MDENLVGYLLNGLDEATHQRVEEQLRTDAQARQRLEGLRQLLAPLAEDRDLQETAPDLTIKTLAHVAEYCCRELPRSPQPAPRSVPAFVPFWRRSDAIVAAGLLFGVLTLGIPIIPRLAAQSGIVHCKKNLGIDLYQGVVTYRNTHDRPPNPFERLDASKERNVIGMVPVMLHSEGVLPGTASICCPATKGFVPCTRTLGEINALNNDEFREQAPKFFPCYAYSLGYLDENGAYHCAMELKPAETPPSARMPLMADCPPPGGDLGNSFNHGKLGQNVLFQDGHVEFCVHRIVGKDDIYLNRNMKVAAGVDCNDAVLGSSASQP